MTADLLVLPLILLVGLAILTIKVVPEYQRIVIFRLGRTNPSLVKGPGLTLVIPFIDRPVWVDLRTAIMEVPAQTAITRDNAPISIGRACEHMETFVLDEQGVEGDHHGR